MIRAFRPDPLEIHRVISRKGDEAVFVFCDSRKTRVEKQRPQGRGASIENEERECRRFNS
jgi:hypothetical protein